MLSSVGEGVSTRMERLPGPQYWLSRCYLAKAIEKDRVLEIGLAGHEHVLFVKDMQPVGILTHNNHSQFGKTHEQADERVFGSLGHGFGQDDNIGSQVGNLRDQLCHAPGRAGDKLHFRASAQNDACQRPVQQRVIGYSDKAGDAHSIFPIYYRSCPNISETHLAVDCLKFLLRY